MSEKVIVNKKLSVGAAMIRKAYRLLVKYFPKELRLWQTEIDGTKYLVWLNEDIGKKMVLTRAFEKNETLALQHMTKPADICVDVGGNVGYYSLNFSRWCGDGHVHAIEPLKRNFLVIELAVLINKIRNITVYRYALAAAEGNATMEVPDEDGAYAHLKIVDEKSVSDELVEMLTLDSFLERHSIARVDMLKIDVEGAESMVLHGAAKLLSDEARKPRVVMIELVNEYLRRFGSDAPAVIRLMEGYGYVPYHASAGGKLEAFGADDIDNIFNIFFLRSAANEIAAQAVAY